MPAKFYLKPAYFESKNQVAPNSLVFSKELGDREIRLLLALNAIATSGGSWVPIQSDIQKRLGWGKEKMTDAIEVCKQLGYMKVRQGRIDKDDPKKKGQFAPNEFEFCLDGTFKENSTVENNIKPPENEYEPRGENPSTGNPSTENQALPCSLLNKPCLKEQQQTGQGALPPAPPIPPEAVVVVSLDKEKQEKCKLLEPFGFSEIVVAEFSQKYGLLRLTDAVQAYHEYAESNAIASELGTLRTAIEKGWKPNKPKVPVAEEAKEKEKSTLENNKKYAKMVAEKFHSDDFYLKLEGNFLFYEVKRNGIILKDSIPLFDEDSQNVINQYLRSKGKI